MRLEHEKEGSKPVNTQTPTTCHPGLDPGSRASLNWMPDQARHDIFVCLSFLCGKKRQKMASFWTTLASFGRSLASFWTRLATLSHSKAAFLTPKTMKTQVLGIWILILEFVSNFYPALAESDGGSCLEFQTYMSRQSCLKKSM